MVSRSLWNVNLHYDQLLDAAVPNSASSVLEVGCGDGFLAARLAGRVPSVTAVDIDAPVLHRAKSRFPDADVHWVNSDVMTARLDLGSFEAVVSNATLHHLRDTRAALTRMGSLVAPGGILAVVGFVRNSPRNGLWQTTSFVARGVAIARRGKWDHTAPTLWPPADSLGELRRYARSALPGAALKRLLYGRFLLTWHCPAGP